MYSSQTEREVDEVHLAASDEKEIKRMFAKDPVKESLCDLCGISFPLHWELTRHRA
jgi:hypothetical protein